MTAAQNAGTIRRSMVRSCTNLEELFVRNSVRKRDEYSTLCATAKSRENLVAQMTELAAECGAVISKRENALWSPRHVGITVSKGPLHCMIDFEGGSKVGAFLGHWYADKDAPRDLVLPSGFAAAIRGDMNPYHRRKATSCDDTFGAFKQSIRGGLNALPSPPAESANA